jgi:predicted peptidase
MLQICKNYFVSKEYLVKKMHGFTAVLAIVLTACTINVGTTDTVSRQNDTVTTRQKSNWDRSYGGADKSYDTELLQLRELIAPRFQTLKFDDKVTGKTMTYNLYIPADYDQSKSYPLVLFMADGSTTGKGSEAPLKQGYGGIIWATDESQAKHPCFVLVPAYEGPENVVNDKWEVSDEVDMTLRLLNSVVSRYSIDKNRLYTTGQSMGGMMSFYFNANHPDLFAASIFVGSQWDINVLGPLANMKFFYIVSAADPKASVGMRELGAMLKEKGVSFGTTEFSAKLPDSEQEKYIQNLLDEGHSINFVQFTEGSVTPTGVPGRGAEHMYSFDYAYKLEAVRNWLFQQTK